MTHAELFGKLREYEMDLTRMFEKKAIDKKKSKKKQKKLDWHII